MAFKPITNPRGAIIRGKNGKAELIWNAGCAPRMNEMLSKKQEIIDSEVLRLCAPMVPKRTGALERSGTLGTVIGSRHYSHPPAGSITTPARPAATTPGVAVCGLSE